MQRSASGNQRPTDVYFFASRLVDLFCPEAGIDAITLIEREGDTVHFPENQTYCGQSAYTSGFANKARAVALTQMQRFPNDWPVVNPSCFCAGIIRHHYPRLFADDPPLKAKTDALAERVFELSEFQLNVLQVCWKDSGQPTTMTLHTSCAVRRELGTHEHVRALLAQLPGVTVAPRRTNPNAAALAAPSRSSTRRFYRRRQESRLTHSKKPEPQRFFQPTAAVC